jgi:hypothetical protein
VRAVQEREKLISRIRQLRRASLVSEAPGIAPEDLGREQLRALEARIEHLEKLVEGLQDSVHRESSRYGKRINELEARVQPGAPGRGTSDDAPARGDEG